MSAPPGVQATGLRLFAESASAAASGILVALRGKHKRLICLEQGDVVHATSNMIEEQFDQELMRKGILGPGLRAEAETIAAEESKQLVAVLAEREMVPSADLTSARENHVRGLVSSTLQWTDAQFEFQSGRPKLDGELLVELPGVQLVLEHVDKHPASLDALRVRIGPPNLRPVVTERAERILDNLSLTDAGKSLLEACDGTRDLSVLLAQSKYLDDELLRPLYGFFLLGVVVPARADTRAAERARDQVGRDECLARLRQAEGADHYLVLGVDPKVNAADIREAYYVLARRYHPDRFSTGPLADLRHRIEAFFTQVTEAYNTLSDPDRRRQYDLDQATKVAKPEESKQDEAYLARENFARAKILLDKKRYHDAVTFLENAVQLDDTKADYHLELGRVLIRNPRRRKDAERHLLRGTQLNPTSVPGFIALGQLYGRMGRNEEAAEALREALRWEPDNVEAKHELSNLG